MAEWIFPSTDCDIPNGLNDSGIEHFRGTAIKSLAREICQNSLDANLPNGKPARVVFSSFSIPTSQVPGLEQLQFAFRQSLEFWKSQKSGEIRKFFDKALQISSQQTISCLRISDFNTTGLTGSAERVNTPWCNLIKATGASDKSDNSGGSFGIGKAAPFACSFLRTVFYSTIDIETKRAYQGVSRLTSFMLPDNNEVTLGVGFYGGEKCTPIFDWQSLDPSFSRNPAETGTDIFIIGFSRNDDNWRRELIASVLDSFLMAIYKGTLEVEVDGIVIDSAALPKLIADYEQDFMENAANYYRVLVADEDHGKTFETDICGYGNVVLKMMIEPGLHRRCAMIRKTGMKILDQDRISSTIPFAGILLIEGERLNAFLRKLETPEHTKWQTGRADNEAEAKRVLKELRKFIIDSLMKMQELDTRNAIDPAVGEFLAFIQEREQEENRSEERKDTLSDKIKATEIKPKKVEVPATANFGSPDDSSETTEDDQGDIVEQGPPGTGSGGNESGGNGHGEGGGQLPGAGNGPHAGENVGPNPTEHRFSLIHVRPATERQICIDKNNGKYLIIFTPSVSAVDGVMKIYQSAESQSYDAVITSVECDQESISFQGNEIRGLTFTAKKPVRITVTLDYHDYTALEVKAHGHQV